MLVGQPLGQAVDLFLDLPSSIGIAFQPFTGDQFGHEGRASAPAGRPVNSRQPIKQFAQSNQVAGNVWVRHWLSPRHSAQAVSREFPLLSTQHPLRGELPRLGQHPRRRTRPGRAGRQAAGFPATARHPIVVGQRDLARRHRSSRAASCALSVTQSASPCPSSACFTYQLELGPRASRPAFMSGTSREVTFALECRAPSEDAHGWERATPFALIGSSLRRQRPQAKAGTSLSHTTRRSMKPAM